MDSLEEKYVCCKCIGDAFLKDIIKTANEIRQCSYCDSKLACMPLVDLAERIERAIQQHYRATDSEPDGLQWIAFKDKESSYEWEREGELVVNIIQYEAEVEENIAKDVQKLLDDNNSAYDDPDESAFDSQIQYAKIQQHNSRWHEQWGYLEHELKTKNRFFSQNALALFKIVFADLSTMATKEGKPVLRKCGPGTDLFELYRARVFQTGERLQEALEQPAQLLGPPNTNATPGRMNAQGISVFYGATSPRVALAEVRPPVGSKVAIAKFIIQKGITLLDLTALKFVKVNGSIFDPELLGRIEQAVFLKSFCENITTPVMPDFQISDYLITQATADYLAADRRLSLDGIIYPSAQTSDDGINVVLFHKSAKATNSNDSTYEACLYSDDEGTKYPDYQIQ